MVSIVPSAARTYPVPTASVLPAGFQPLWIQLAPKSSADVMDYTLDFTQWIGLTGDTVSNVTVNVPTSTQTYPVVAIATQVNGPLATFLLASGMPNTQTAFTVEITTAQGRVYSQAVQIVVTGTTPATPAPNAGSGIVLPDDVTVNGGVLQAGATPLPAGTSSNGGIVMLATGATPPVGYVSNGNVLMKAAS